jgi:hypothetical protein
LQSGADVHLHYLKSHQNAIFAASRNPGEAATVGPKLLEVMTHSIRNGMRVLAITPSGSNHRDDGEQSPWQCRNQRYDEGFAWHSPKALSKNFLLKKSIFPSAR